MGQATPEDVRTFWFGQPDLTKPPTLDKGRWWKSTPAFDAEIEDRFGSRMQEALDTGLPEWRGSPEDLLSLILLCDQFPRNVHRGTGKAFAWDARAREVATILDNQGAPTSWQPDALAFSWMPFEHSEAMADQDRCVARFESLAQAAPQAKFYVDFAVKHRDIIAQFGRFPHRNRALGRDTTAEERDFLANGGPSFGQG